MSMIWFESYLALMWVGHASLHSILLSFCMCVCVFFKVKDTRRDN